MKTVKSISQKGLSVEMIQLQDSYKVLLSKNDKLVESNNHSDFNEATLAFDAYLELFGERNIQ